MLMINLDVGITNKLSSANYWQSSTTRKATLKDNLAFQNSQLKKLFLKQLQHHHPFKT